MDTEPFRFPDSYPDIPEATFFAPTSEMYPTILYKLFSQISNGKT
jgi:hypothetical protein